MEWIILGIPMAILTCFTQKHSHSTTFWLSCLWCIVSLVLFNLDLCKSKLRIIVYSSNKTGWSSCTLTVTCEMNWKKKQTFLLLYTIASWQCWNTALYVTPQSNRVQKRICRKLPKEFRKVFLGIWNYFTCTFYCKALLFFYYNFSVQGENSNWKLW